MDSANSGSMQSSSGGDEEYDSRAESISAFLNNPPSHIGLFSTTNSPHPLPHPPQHHHTHIFDPLSNYFDPIQRPTLLSNSNSLLNLDMAWSKPVRSEPNPPDLGGLIPSSSSPQNQAFLSSQLAGQTRGSVFPPTQVQHPLVPESASRGLLSVSAANDHSQNMSSSATTNNNVVRNSKKRSRASRRAPTTVLTTDTTNFRAMVQEFTGIPAPPFTSSPFPRTRLDLFGSSATPSIRSAHLDPPPPPYLLRPFAQKLQPPHPFLSPPPSSSSIPALQTTSVVGTVASNSTNNTTSIVYPLSSDLGLLKQPSQNLLNVNMHNPILNFQSILQAPPKYPLGNSSMLGIKNQGSLEIPPSAYSHLKMGVLEEFGLNHVHVNTNVSGLQNLVSSSSDRSLSRENMSHPPPDWAERRSKNNDHGVLGSVSGNYSNTERVTNGKVNYPASSSDFHGEKGPECVAGRSEGMVESWINCSSD